VTLSAMFTFAKRKGIYDGVNPMTGVTIPKGKRHGRKRLAYALEEVEKHLELFSGTEPIVILTETFVHHVESIGATFRRGDKFISKNKTCTASPMEPLFCGGFECFYEKVIKVKADMAALLSLFSDVSLDVRW
jgi:hypothetical protein